MKQRTVDYLEANQSKTPSKWKEEAEWRRANHDWLWHSQRIAVKVMSRMREEHLSQTALAERMECTQQYVSKILHGQENLSLEMLAKLENALNIQLVCSEIEDTPIMKVAEDDSVEAYRNNIKK